VSVRFREKIQAVLWWSDNSLKVELRWLVGVPTNGGAKQSAQMMAARPISERTVIGLVSSPRRILRLVLYAKPRI
jgi:hypothetical protein